MDNYMRLSVVYGVPVDQVEAIAADFPGDLDGLELAVEAYAIMCGFVGLLVSRETLGA